MEELIQRLKEELKDVKEHDADFCNVTVSDTEAIIEYFVPNNMTQKEFEKYIKKMKNPNGKYEKT